MDLHWLKFEKYITSSGCKAMFKKNRSYVHCISLVNSEKSRYFDHYIPTHDPFTDNLNLSSQEANCPQQTLFSAQVITQTNNLY